MAPTVATPIVSAAKLPGVEAYESDVPIALVLATTSPGRNALEGSAAIGTSLESAQTFAMGGLLPNGTRLIEVHSDHVLLERDRAHIQLFVANAKPPKVIGSSKLSDRMGIERHLLSVGGPESHGEETKPAALGMAASLLRSQPVFVNGLLRGLQVDPGSAEARFAASGLKAGDVVTAIDGLKVEQPEQIEDLIGALSSGVAVIVTVEREGQLEHVSLDMGRLDDPRMNATQSAGPAPTAPALPPQTI